MINRAGSNRMNVSAKEKGIQPVIVEIVVLITDAMFSVKKSEKVVFSIEAKWIIMAVTNITNTIFVYFGIELYIFCRVNRFWDFAGFSFIFDTCVINYFFEFFWELRF